MTATITGLLVLAGGVFALLGGLGMLRLPDVLIRMHASTKIGTLASALTLLGAAAHFGTATGTEKIDAPPHTHTPIPPLP